MESSTNTAPSSPADRAEIAPVPRNCRSAITNRSRVIDGVDLRTRAGRRWRDVFVDLIARTGGRHEALVRTAATLTIAREELDARIARGEDVDVGDLVRLSGALTRVMARVGLVAEGNGVAVVPSDMTDEAVAAAKKALR